eukprot:jgi/Bigna1/146183/aug1.110_g20891
MFLVNAAAKIPAFFFACLLQDSRRRVKQHRAEGFTTMAEYDDMIDVPSFSGARRGKEDEEDDDAGRRRGRRRGGVRMMSGGSSGALRKIWSAIKMRSDHRFLSDAAADDDDADDDDDNDDDGDDDGMEIEAGNLYKYHVIVLAGILNLSVLILVFSINKSWGVPDLPFAMGDTVVVDMSQTLLGFPLLMLVATIAQNGVEGSTYSLINSISDAGGTVSSSVSAQLITAFGVTLEDFSNLWKLLLLCSLLRLAALPFIPLLPEVRIVEDDDRRTRTRRSTLVITEVPNPIEVVDDEEEVPPGNDLPRKYEQKGQITDEGGGGGGGGGDDTKVSSSSHVSSTVYSHITTASERLQAERLAKGSWSGG